MREAVFLHVWLKRQDIELTKARLLATGFVDPTALKGVYEDLQRAFYPFLKGEKKTEDKELMEKMAKEVSKGPIMFKLVDPVSHLKHTPVQNMPNNIKNILQKKATTKVLK